jgi:hypothetical protein
VEQKRVGDMTKEEISEIVKETLVQLGIDASSPEGIIAFQQDMAYVRTIRGNTDKIKTMGWLTIFGVFISIVITALKHH